MRINLLLLTITVALSCCPVFADDAQPVKHPMSAQQRAAIQKRYEAQLKAIPAPTTKDGLAVSAHSRRGDAYLFLGKFDDAVREYKAMIDIDPDLDVSHWRLGIAYFYANRFQDGADQFGRYHAYDNVDRENGIWRYLCQYKAAGPKAAGAELIKYEKDDREPFPAVYRLFDGTLTPQQALDKIPEDLPEVDRNTRLFYTELYIGMLLVVQDKPEEAAQYMARSVSRQKGPFRGSMYMWNVARVQLEELLKQKAGAKAAAKPGADASKLPKVLPLPEDMKEYSQKITQTDESIALVPIPGGTFLMGSPATEAERGDDEGPQHTVEVAPFWMGKFEITWNQYDVWGENIDIARRKIFGQKPTKDDLLADSVTRPTPPYTDMSFGMGKLKNPAICMTQHAARKYCEWLSAKTGHYYRLPTEAEWEFACRAGTTTAYSFGDDLAKLDDYAWHAGNSEDEYHEVGLKKPNPWGLHDIHGNVAEWVLDQYLPDAYAKRKGVTKNPLAVPNMLFPRIVRGGGYDDEPRMLRSAVREGSSEEWKEQDPQVPQSIWYHTDALGVGFRIVRPYTEPSAEEKAARWEKTAPVQLDPVVE